MKKFLTLILLFAALYSNATTYYISPTGNDATGNGTISNPWRTLFKACQTVNTSGDIIHVNAGTYTEIAQCVLAVGVSVEGDGATSILRTTRTALYESLLYLQSTQGTSGNQSVSFLRFEGTMTAQQGIQINGRSNVSVHDITMVDFFERGLIFTGALNQTLTAYATGNSCYNNTITNCAMNNGTGQGCLAIGGQNGMLIYNNTITQNSRADGLNGWPIKYIDEGHLKNVKIYNNTFNKNMQTGLKSYIDWPFVMELFNLEGGNEIYNNNCVGGGIDLVFMTKGTSTYSVWVHDNNISCPTLPVATQMGVTLENMENPFPVDIRDIIIEKNIFTNLSLGIYFTARPGAVVNNITIQNNLMVNHSGIGQSGAFINLGENGGATTYTNINIYNNTLIANPSAPFYTGIVLPSFCAAGSTINNINVINNNISGSSAGSVFCQGNAVAISNLNISNNNFYNNNLDTDFRNGQVITNYTNANNIHVTPTYNGNYTLPNGSPLIDTGINVGLAYNGTKPDIGYAEYISGGNASPSANAGTNQTITLPTNSTTLTGSGTDPDGTIASYAWTMISGPAGSTITSASSAVTTITGLVLGVYVFRLTVTDNLGATGYANVQITVSSVVNVPPVANAGPDQSITLPTNIVNLSGSGTDANGTITAYLWTKVSGPASGTITTATSAATSVTGLVQGVYRFELRVTDNGGAFGRDTMQVTVNPVAGNAPPTANAGANQSITLPTNTVNLSGSGTDPDGTIASYAWTKFSGPTGGIITSPSSAATSITGLIQGVYVFRLTVTDNLGATGFANVQITVNAAANTPPTANAGANQSITLPTNTVNLSGSGTDPDGTIASYAWTKFSGPTGGIITSPSSAATSITGLIQGVYVFRLTVTDNLGATGFANVQITVNAAANTPPIANAGLDQSITLPTSTVNLAGSGTDANGTITAYLWTKISGPTGAGTITNAASAATSVTALIAGIYKFELRVTDNNGATGTDTMQVIVFAPNIAPVANAGLDQSITLPTNTANLSGSGTDTDGTIAAYKWTKISGPSGETITNSILSGTTVSGLSAGVYVFELRVTDNNGATGTDMMQVTVNPENIPPVANAGPDQSIILPTNSVTLTGRGTDVDGTITSFRWRQVSGPVDKLTSINTAITVLDNLIEGTYKLELTVTDNKGATGKDTVSVNVANVTAPTQNKIKVYPNPIVDFTTLEINSTNTIDNSPLLVVVTDMQGKIVYKKQLTTGSYTIKEKLIMSNLSKGAYLITVYFNSGDKQTIKAIKI